MRLPKKRAFDLAWLDRAQPGESGVTLQKLLSGRAQDALLLKINSDEDESLGLHRGLVALDREVRLMEAERGAYDLAVGVGFLCGALAEGKTVQAPVLLLPRRLLLDGRGREGTRWTLRPLEDPREVRVNRTLLLALQKYMNLTMDPEALEEEASELLFSGRREPGWLGTLTAQLAELLNARGLSCTPSLTAWGQPLGEPAEVDQLPPLPLYRADQLPNPPPGRYELRPHAVLSRFPLADTALLTDYERLIQRVEHTNTAPRGYAGALLGDPQALANLIGERRGPAPKAARWHVEQTDESQEAALDEVMAGRSMAVHGPPGTGKSQLITNVLTSALAAGERVLVVSQKRAALDVLAGRLGPELRSLVALVHDPVHDRAALCDQLKTRLTQASRAYAPPDESARVRLIEEIRREERWFDGAHEALVKELRPGFTTTHALTMRLKHPGDPTALTVRSLPRLSPEELDAATPALVRHVEDIAEAWTPGTWRASRPSLAARGPNELDALLEQTVPDTIRAIEQTLQWEAARAPGLEALEATAARQRSAEAVVAWCDLAKPLSEESWGWVGALGPGARSAVSTDLNTLDALFARRAAAEGVPLTSLAQAEEAERLFDEVRRLSSSWLRYLMPSWYMGLDRVRALFSAERLSTDQLLPNIAVWERRAEYTRALHAAERSLGPLRAASLDLRKLDERTISTLRRVVPPCAEVVEAWASLSEDTRRWAGAMPTSEHGTDHLRAAATHALRAPALLATLTDAQRSLEAWLGPVAAEWIAEARRQGTPTRIRERVQTELVASFDLLSAADRRVAEVRRRWPALTKLVEEACLRGGLDVAAELGRAYAELWLREAEEAHPVLKDLNQVEADRRRETLRASWSQLRGENHRALVARAELAVAQVSETHQRELLRRATQQRQRWPIRKLVEQLWDKGLAAALPIWLCSPETVAAVFPIDAPCFDRVIFDEASQCTLAQGLTSVVRGRSCVVVGDEKQLPPSNLFSTTLEDDEEETEQGADEESLLSRASGVGASTSLLWHYRSQYPELIQLSNRRFYAHQLRVSALPMPRLDPPALQWVQVPGAWSRRENHAEALAAVELLARYLRDHPTRSLGVITLNRQQSDHIQDLVDRRLESDEAFRTLYEDAMRRDMDERPFVRNLENVQGDERDVIVLSIGYSANDQGHVPLNFGALSQSGGERRLNVAISRARQKMLVLCSFDPATQLQVTESVSQGAQALREFLLFAKQPDRSPDSEAAAARSPIVHDHLVATLIERLREFGWQAEASVGASAARVDLAVRSRSDPTRFVLGVLLDGPGAAWARTSLGRELGRAGYLERYHWAVHHVTARSLVRAPSAVMVPLLKRLEREDERLTVHPTPPSVAIGDIYSPDPAAPPPAPQPAGPAPPRRRPPGPSPRRRSRPAPPPRRSSRRRCVSAPAAPCALSEWTAGASSSTSWRGRRSPSASRC
ncbi:MAG: AAA family ATPase [Sandaracinaceae bacterium]|nr:AAA family ATPase [Sandaracinaceae bacterium]